MLGRLQGCGRKRARIDAALPQKQRRPISICQGRLELRERRGQAMVRAQCWMIWSREHQCPLITQIHVHAGLILKLVDKLGIHSRASPGQRFESDGHFEDTIGQHTRRSVRRLAAGLPPLDQENSCSSFAQRDRQAKSNDSAADDDDVPGLHHSGIVEDHANCCLCSDSGNGRLPWALGRGWEFKMLAGLISQ